MQLDDSVPLGQQAEFPGSVGRFLRPHIVFQNDDALEKIREVRSAANLQSQLRQPRSVCQPEKTSGPLSKSLKEIKRRRRLSYAGEGRAQRHQTIHLGGQGATASEVPSTQKEVKL